MAVEVTTKVAQYRQYIEQILNDQAKRVSSPTLERQVIIDSQRDHYQLVNVGWNPNGYRSYGCIIHLDIKGNKIWVQHDGTETGVAHTLVDLGVPKHDIVLAFHTVSMRKHTGFAVS